MNKKNTQQKHLIPEQNEKFVVSFGAFFFFNQYSSQLNRKVLSKSFRHNFVYLYILSFEIFPLCMRQQYNAQPNLHNFLKISQYKHIGFDDIKTWLSFSFDDIELL